MTQTAIRLTPGVNADKTPSLNEAGVSSSQMIRFREGMIEKRGGWSRFYATAVSGVPRALWGWRDFSGRALAAVGTTSELSVIAAGVKKQITPCQVSYTLANCFGADTILNNGNNTEINLSNSGYPPYYPGVDIDPTELQILEILNIVSVGGITLNGRYNFATQAFSYPGFNTNIFVLNKNVTTTESGVAYLPTYTSTLGSSTISISLHAHGLQAGGTFVLKTPVIVGGVTLVGLQSVARVVDPNTFTVLTGTLATSAASFTPSSITIVYNPSNPSGTTPRGTPITTPDWSLSNYGEQLIACANGGYIYKWLPEGVDTTAVVIPNAPIATGIVISDAAQQIIAYGGNATQNIDPNVVSWCSQGDPTTWTASATNQAGTYRIPTGSGVIGATAVASNAILLWTDVDCWSMQYLGYPFVYGFNKLAVGCGLVAQFAWAKLGTVTYWMSQKKFWGFMGGIAQPIDCPVWDKVFPLIDPVNAWKIRGGSNAGFGEVVWFFPSVGGTGENDSYVCFNPVEGAWDYGSLARSAWIDQSVVGQPLGASPTGLIYQHETSPDADGSALPWSFTTGFSQIAEGDDFLFIDKILPDFKFPNGTGSIQVTLLVSKYVGDTPVVKGPYTFSQATDYINTRARGRYVAFQFSGNDLGSFWRIGRTQVRFTTDGKR